VVTYRAKSQSVDSNFVTMISALNWFPDGNTMLLNIVKFDKTRKTPPVSKSFTYTISNGILQPSAFEGNGKTPSPDGKKLAYFRQNIRIKSDLYIYDLETGVETPVVIDSFHKFAASFSPDGKKIVYNRESNGRGRFATIEVCVVDMLTKEIKQVTNSGSHKSYNPVWAPSGDRIVYYFEQGDNRDQVWLTDANGSFHTNLTNDTSTHNFFPSWINDNLIVYTQSPNNIMTIRPDGTDKKKIQGINAFVVKYNMATGKAAYVTQQPESKLIIYDWKTGTSTVLIDPSALK
jgi:Tol biopolymer transport system component